MKQLLYIFSAALLFTACKKDTARVFDESPEERMGARIDELNNLLLSAPNGWKVSLTTTAKGGYGFYMDFKEDNVSMVADLNASTTTTTNTSTWRIKWVMNATLIFDTYNYISMLQDPSPSSYGGASGSGLKSDVEWEYQGTSGDTVKMKGFKYRNDMFLVKATADEKARFLSSAYKDNVDAFNQFFAEKNNNYINIDGIGNKVEFIYDYLAKAVKFQYVNNEGGVVQSNGKFNFEDIGLNIAPGFAVAGISFSKAELENGALVLYTTTGAKYTVSQHTQPILPMPLLFAYNGTYKELFVTGVLPAGVTSGFNTIWQSAVTKFAQLNPPRTIVDFRFILANSTNATLTVRSNNGSSTYSAVGTFKYTYENGVITLSNFTYDGNWSPRIPQLIDVQNFFINAGPFRIDYVTSSNPNVTNLGGLYSIADPSIFFYGTLRK